MNNNLPDEPLAYGFDRFSSVRVGSYPGPQSPTDFYEIKHLIRTGIDGLNQSLLRHIGELNGSVEILAREVRNDRARSKADASENQEVTRCIFSRNAIDFYLVILLIS